MAKSSIIFDPPVLAHRGASSYAPENTMSAFVRAVQLGIEWVEFDVMLAACGTPIIFHDDTLDRTTNGHGFVGNFSYAYLQTLDAGSWFNPQFSGERIPTLEQVAQFLKESGLRANVEIKPLPGQDEVTVKHALRVINQYFSPTDRSILYSSFSLPALQYLRQFAPQCQLGLLMHEWRDDWQSIADSLSVTAVNVNMAILNAGRAAEIKATGKQLLAYTVNDIELAEKLFSHGVDAVFSDCADQIARFA